MNKNLSTYEIFAEKKNIKFVIWYIYQHQIIVYYKCTADKKKTLNT